MTFFNTLQKRLPFYLTLAVLAVCSPAFALYPASSTCLELKRGDSPLMNVQALTRCVGQNDTSGQDRAEIFKQRAKIYVQLVRYNQALKDYNSALELKPDDAEIYNGLGIVYKRLGEYKLAMKNYAIAQDLSTALPTQSIAVHTEPVIEKTVPEKIEIVKIKAVNNKIIFGPRTVTAPLEIQTNATSPPLYTEIEISGLIPIEKIQTDGSIQ